VPLCSFLCGVYAVRNHRSQKCFVLKGGLRSQILLRWTQDSHRIRKRFASLLTASRQSGRVQHEMFVSAIWCISRVAVVTLPQTRTSLDCRAAWREARQNHQERSKEANTRIRIKNSLKLEVEVANSASLGSEEIALVNAKKPYSAYFSSQPMIIAGSPDSLGLAWLGD